MKKIRIVLTVAAFCLAIVFAVAGAMKTDDTLLTAYAYVDSQCVVGELMQSGCGSSGTNICTVYVEDVGIFNAYQFQQSTNSCAVLYQRW